MGARGRIRRRGAVAGRRAPLGVLAVAALAVAMAPGCGGGPRSGAVVLGVPEAVTTTSAAAAHIVPEAQPDAGSAGPAPARRSGSGRSGSAGGAVVRSGTGLRLPDARGWPPAVAFTSSQSVPSGLVFVLVAGSDARPGEDVRRTRADSIHLVAANPDTRQATVIGIPRDAWVEIPGRGRGKINDALALGGPDLLSATVRRLTGLPVHYYALTGFSGLSAMVDEIGGLDVPVERRMNDKASGARFEPGWHHMSGAEVLAFSRNRHDVPDGDFGRSAHHGVVLLAALAKLRSEVADDPGLARWTGILLRRVQLDMPPSELPRLAALARRIDPARATNVVVPGRVGSAGGGSVVYLGREAAAIFDDVRADGVIGNATAEPPPSPAPAATPPGPAPTTSTTGPPPATTTTTEGLYLGPSTTTTTSP